VALATDVERAILARERAALRRLGILAGSAAPIVVFEAMAQELARIADLSTGTTRVDMAAVVRYERDELVVVAAWGEADALPAPVGSRWPLDGDSVSARVYRSRRPTRIEGYTGPPGSISNHATSLGVRSTVGVPIVVDGELWGGATVLSSRPEPLPPETEERLADFAELAATAISGAHAREKAQRLADEQAALRRVATLVAQGVEPAQLFAAVTAEVGQLLEADAAMLIRSEASDEITIPAIWSADGERPELDDRYPIKPGAMTDTLAATGELTCVDDWSQMPGEIGPLLRERLRARHSVGCPIAVGGGLWGLLTVHSTKEELPPGDTEPRLASFAKLVATAISNAEAQANVRRLADEQAALRRIATLVAHEADPEAVCRAVTDEVAGLHGVDSASLVSFEPGDTLRVVAATLDEALVGSVWPIEGGAAAMVARTGQAARLDDWDAEAGTAAVYARETLGVRSSVACPIVVEGGLWGALAVTSRKARPVPPRTEERLASFAELVATAIANARARAKVRRLAEEQASLRRLATLVAREASPDEVFASVVEEVGSVLGVSDSRLLRYEPDGTATVLASWGALRDRLPVGTNAPVGGRNVTALVRRTGRAVRIDDYEHTSGALAAMVKGSGLRSAVACPVVVNGRLWGVTVAASMESEGLPADTEARLTEFTELVATAIANIDARTALAASRVRIVAAADEARKRMERDLHDGAQQRLVSLALRLRATEAMAPPELDELRSALDQLSHGLTEVHESLRELSHGIHPSVLSEAGLRAALRALARRSAIPVTVDYEAGERYDEGLEVTAYYVVSEALANVVKHSGAECASVEVTSDEGELCVVVADDGTGGADPVRGSGMIGLIDRVEARGGTLHISSPVNGGTTLRVALPLQH
jgi:GAF domain-containing protein